MLKLFSLKISFFQILTRSEIPSDFFVSNKICGPPPPLKFSDQPVQLFQSKYDIHHDLLEHSKDFIEKNQYDQLRNDASIQPSLPFYINKILEETNFAAMEKLMENPYIHLEMYSYHIIYVFINFLMRLHDVSNTERIVATLNNAINILSHNYPDIRQKVLDQLLTILFEKHPTYVPFLLKKTYAVHSLFLLSPHLFSTVVISKLPDLIEDIELKREDESESFVIFKMLINRLCMEAFNDEVRLVNGQRMMDKETALKYNRIMKHLDSSFFFDIKN